MNDARDPDRPVLSVGDLLISSELAHRPVRARDYAAENRALSALSDTMAANPEGVLQKVAEVAMDLCNAESAGISVLERGDNGRFRWYAATGAFAVHLHGTMPRDTSPCGVVMARNEVLLFHEPDRFFPELREVKPRIYEGLLAPWVVNGTLTGTLWVIMHSPERRFDAEDARLLASFARFASAAWQTVTALHSARSARQQLEERVEERTRELRETQAQLEADVAGLRRLHEVHARIATETNLKPALDEILAAACEFTHTDRGCVQLVSDDGQRLEMFAWRGYADHSPFIEHFRYDGLKEGCDVARVERRRMIIEDTVGFPGLEGTEAGTAAAASGILAAQSTPIVSRKHETVGVLSTQFTRPHRPSDEELRLMDLLAWTAADFVERYRFETALRDTEERQAFLLKLNDALSPLADAAEIKATASRLLGEHLGLNRAMYVEGEDENWLVDEGYVRGLEPLPEGRYPMVAYGEWVDKPLRAGQIVVIRDARGDRRCTASERATYKALQTPGVVAVPLVRKGRLVAALSVHSAAARDWTTHEIAIIKETAERTWAAVERVRAERALRESEERFRLLVNNVQEYAVFQTDPESKVTSWNPGAQHLFGYTAAEMIGELADRLFSPEDRNVLADEISRVMQGAREESARWLVRKDGSKFWARWVTEPIRDDSGSIRGVAKILRNETGRRQAEESTRSSLAEKEALLREVHHRVKNNLQVIISLLNMQARQIENEDVVNLFEETRNRVQSIASIHELLYRGESFAAVALSPYALQLAPDLVRFYGLEQRVTVAVIGEGAALELERAVPYGLLLNELVSNACKHAFVNGQRGQITITIRPDGDQIQMSVADNGTGLPPGFDYRRGSSLGMKLVGGLVRQLRGSIEFGSGSGTTALVRLPGATKANT